MLVKTAGELEYRVLSEWLAILMAVVGGTRSVHVGAIEKSASYCGKCGGFEMQLLLPGKPHIVKANELY